MSDSWKKGRFKDQIWNREIAVEVATLDGAIGRFGRPDYCKIDVEGFESEVLTGLTIPLRLVSFEFTKEGISNYITCIEQLRRLGFLLFNVMYGESGNFRYDTWIDPDHLIHELQKLRLTLSWGDIYACCELPSQELVEFVVFNDVSGKVSLDELRRVGLAYEGAPLRLHLGCGETVLDDYVNIDYPQEQHSVYSAISDFQVDILTLEFPDCTVDEVRLHHVFEHLNRTVAIAQLIKWHSWLKIGGRLVIETPDFEASALEFSQATDLARKLRTIRHLEGDQASGWAYHVGQWFPERFRDTLHSLGFADIEITTSESCHIPPLFNVIATAIKKQSAYLDEQRQSGLALLRQFMVAEAEKPTFDVWSKQLNNVLSGGYISPTILHPSREDTPQSRLLAQHAFRNGDTVRLDQRRQEHLASLGLSFEGKSVLEIGAEIGDRTSFFIDRNCSICTSESNINLFDVLSSRYYWMRSEHIDLHDSNVAFVDTYEVLYTCNALDNHADPAAAIQKLSEWCTGILVLESQVLVGTKSTQDQVTSATTKSPDGRLYREWIVAQLKLHFPHVYCTATQPWHPDFRLDWEDVVASSSLSRAVFVASRTETVLPTLLDSIPSRQVRH